MKRQCPECERPVRGRIDKKFCSDYCRSTYHNRRNSHAYNYIRTVNGILKRNRKVLCMLRLSGYTQVHRLQLSEQGFLFHYFTTEYRNRQGRVCRFCYDYGFEDLEDGFVRLLVREN